MVKINGQQLETAGRTVSEFLISANYDLRLVAVERNGVIVPKDKFTEAVLQDGDTVEVVSFVGGG